MLQIKRYDYVTERDAAILTLSDVPEGAIVHRELMGDHYVMLSFSLPEPIYFQVGDWCFIKDYGRFELTKPQIPKYNTSTSGYDYELQLDAYYLKWRNKICKYIPTDMASETSFNLTAAIDVHLAVITRNINALGEKDTSFLYEGRNFTYALRNFDLSQQNAARHKLYDNTDIISALDDLAKIFDCEWWVDDNIICFGRLELEGEVVNFAIDVNVSDITSSESKKEFANRIYAFGSDRNLPKNYRKNESADFSKIGVVQKRLMLPLDACPYGYVDDNITESDAVEAVMVDNDIYPKLESEVSEVITYETNEKDENGNTIYEEGHEGESGYEKKHTYYRVKDKNGFKLIYDDESGKEIDLRLDGLVPHILFTSGRMNGMDFECIYDKNGDYYEIVENDEYGRSLPDPILCPQARRVIDGETIDGDKFVIYNWDSTRIGNTNLIKNAEEALYQSAIKKLAKLKIDPNTYTCKMMSDVYEENMRTSDFTYTHYDLGQKVVLNNPAYFKDGRNSRIIGYEIKLDIPFDEPQYIVGEATAYSRSADMQSQIDALTLIGVSYQSGGSGGNGVFVITSTSQAPASDTNVYSAKRSDMQFLRKDRADTAKGKITHKQLSVHEQGVQFGDSYAEGLTGLGGKIDGNGRGELESLRLRRFLEVPELRYNRVEIQVGNQWRAPGGGIIENVIPDRDEQGNILATGTIKLHLEDGEIGAIAVDDICQGIYHDGIAPENNEKTSADDGIGNFQFAGFFTCYFRVTEITETGNNSEFRYALRPANASRTESGGGNWTHSHHPCEGMHFVAYGNFSNSDRQTSRYSTLTYERFLMGVNWWEFRKENIGAQFGDLSNLSVFGLDMAGYSAYLNNIYMSGTIHQFEEDLPLRMEIDTQGENFLAYGENLLVTCRVMRGWEDMTAEVREWEVTRDSGDAADDAAWKLRNKVKDFCGGNQNVDLESGQIILCHEQDPTLDDLGNRNVLSTIFTFKAYLKDNTTNEDTAQFQLII